MYRTEASEAVRRNVRIFNEALFIKSKPLVADHVAARPGAPELLATATRARAGPAQGHRGLLRQSDFLDRPFGLTDLLQMVHFRAIRDILI